MRKKVFKTLVAVLALAAVTGPVRGQTVPDVEYNLRGIPQGWTATANGNNVTVTDGKTAPIDPASPVSLTPPAADIHRVQNVTLSSITINLDEVDMTNPPVVIVCGDGDTITGSVTGDIFIILPDLQQVNPAGPKVTFKNANIVNTSSPSPLKARILSPATLTASPASPWATATVTPSPSSVRATSM